jgi:presenilin-like A22 family membrane protease
MEAHVIDMAFYLPTYQYPILFVIPTHEGLASAIEDTHTNCNLSATYGAIFTQMAKNV